MAKRIDVKDLNIYYGDFKAVEGVTMTVEPRSVTSFIGPSGCGKSTVLRTLNRMHEVIPGARVHGSVMLDDQDIYASSMDPVAVRAHHRHGVPAAEPVPHHVDPRQRGGRAEAPRRCKGKKHLDEVVERSLKSANLWNEVKDRLDKPGAGLSGGQQQRLCIARAIAVNPQVLLMDEPCSALDPISTLAIEDLINELKSDYTIVIVTHNMQQAARVSRPDGVLQPQGHRRAGPAGRGRRHRSASSATPPRRPPRTTSPAASADPHPRLIAIYPPGTAPQRAPEVGRSQ